MSKEIRFDARVAVRNTGHVYVAVPIRPNEVWGKKPRHYVTATINGISLETSLGYRAGEVVFPLAKSFRERAQIEPGQSISVILQPRDP